MPFPTPLRAPAFASAPHSLVAHVTPVERPRVVVVYVLDLVPARGRAVAGAAGCVRHHHVAHGQFQLLRALGRRGIPLSPGHYRAAGMWEVFSRHSKPESKESQEGPGEQRAVGRHGRRGTQGRLGARRWPWPPLSAGAGQWGGPCFTPWWDRRVTLYHFLLWQDRNRMQCGEVGKWRAHGKPRGLSPS